MSGKGDKSTFPLFIPPTARLDPCVHLVQHSLVDGPSFAFAKPLSQAIRPSSYRNTSMKTTFQTTLFLCVAAAMSALDNSPRIAASDDVMDGQPKLVRISAAVDGSGRFRQGETIK